MARFVFVRKGDADLNAAASSSSWKEDAGTSMHTGVDIATPDLAETHADGTEKMCSTCGDSMFQEEGSEWRCSNCEFAGRFGFGGGEKLVDSDGLGCAGML